MLQASLEMGEEKLHRMKKLLVCSARKNKQLQRAEADGYIAIGTSMALKVPFRIYTRTSPSPLMGCQA